MSSPSINILICTINERINLVPRILLPSEEGIAYIVSHQTEGDFSIPQELLQRPDVKVVSIKGKGLSANRNNALRNATGDLLILADDDITLRKEYLAELQQLASLHPETDIFTLQALTPEGEPLHYYPAEPFAYPKIPKGFYYNSMGIVLRGHRTYPAFDTRFGLGSERLPMGEEDVFLCQCHKRGLKIGYYPQPLLVTPSVTTSQSYASTPALQQAKGAVLTILHGKMQARLRFISTALKMQKTIPFMPHMHNLKEGMRYILSEKQEQNEETISLI